MKQESGNIVISYYLKYLKEKNSTHFISDKTDYDLNVDELFEYFDHTTSRIGQQYFYAKLRAVNTSNYSPTHEKITQQFTDDSDFATQTEKQLKKLSKQEAYDILSLITKELPVTTKLYTFFISILRFVPFLFALLFFTFHWSISLIFLIVSLVVNLFFHYRNKTVQIPFQHSMPQLLLLVQCSHELSINPKFKSISTDISKCVDSLLPISKISNLFKFERILLTDVSQFSWLTTELLKISILSEPHMFHKAVKLIKGKQHEIEKLYCFVGEIDSLLAISKIRHSEAYCCIPSICETNERFAFKELYHPLIESCVSNSLTVQHKSILLTGSNMSGKSTFIRTIGLNVLLAQNINTCFARNFSLQQHLVLQSMITVGDDLMNSKSLFFEEVLTVKEMLINCSNGKNIFLLDEIFKGTNTFERIAAGKAVLTQLVKNGNIVFVSSHDIELCELLEEEYELYHFCEHIQNSEVEFDYLLKQGRLTAFNAIKILKMNGYSDEIIEEAYETVARLQAKVEHN